MKKFIALLTVVTVSLFSGFALGAAFDINPFVPASLSFMASCFVPQMSGVLNILAFTAPGGIAAPFAFPLKFLPQFLTWNNVVALTSLQISTKEDGVIQQYNAAMIAAMNGYECKGALPANNVIIRVATGDVKGKDVTISGVTSAAGAIGFFVNSDNASPNARPFRVATGNILALTPTMFEKFTALFIPALAAATDRVEVEYSAEPRHRQILENQEIQALSAIWQQVPGIIINNVDSYISKVYVTCAAATPAYILSVVL